MFYRQLGATGVQVSAMGLGGHEFRPDGKSRGFNDDPKLAVTPGHIIPGFGGPQRKRLVSLALDAGINLFDVTIDSEKEALGRVLAEIKPSQEVLVQTRPEGMVYNYDPANRMMADYDLLRAEAIRILGLLRRETIDIFNLAFMQDALDADPEYMDKIGDNVRRLKQEGLIRFASADTFSGQDTYLAQIGADCFDSADMNLNFADTAALQRVIPAAVEQGMAVVTREVFVKGALFAMGREAGISDTNLLARLSLKWNLAVPGVTSVLVGADTTDHLANALSVVEDLDYSDEEASALEQLMATELFATTLADKSGRFLPAQVS